MPQDALGRLQSEDRGQILISWSLLKSRCCGRLVPCNLHTKGVLGPGDGGVQQTNRGEVTWSLHMRRGPEQCGDRRLLSQ
jgi:hypothetical protein